MLQIQRESKNSAALIGWELRPDDDFKFHKSIYSIKCLIPTSIMCVLPCKLLSLDEGYYIYNNHRKCKGRQCSKCIM